MRFTGRAMLVPLVVIHYFDVNRPNVSPYEADAPLIVDADAVLPFPVALERFKMVARRGLEKIQRLSSVQL